MSLFRRYRPEPAQERSLYTQSISDPAVAMLLGYASDPGAPLVSDINAMTLSAVWRAVSIISGTIASLPLRTLETVTDGSRERTVSVLDNPASGQTMTPYEWKELVLIHLLLRGNAYLQHLYNGAGALVGLWPVYPGSVSVIHDENYPSGKRFEVAQTDGTVRQFDTTSMTHIHGPSLDGFMGLSPIAQARMSIGTGLNGEKAASRMFINGAMISGLVTPTGDETLTEEDAAVLKADLGRKMAGSENAGSIAVVNKALTFTPWTMTARDAEFLASRAFSIEEIARWFGVPPHLLAQTEKQTSWGKGVAEQNDGLARYTLMPWTTRIEERLTMLLPRNKSAEFDYSGFLRPAPETEIPLILQQVETGFITPNEGRRIRNLPPIDGGDELRIPTTTSVGVAPAPVEQK